MGKGRKKSDEGDEEKERYDKTENQWKITRCRH
jgi:hypothetical protein